MRIALIGYGYWGPHYARIIDELVDTELGAICEKDPARRARARLQYPGVPVFSSIYDLPKIEAAIISTPASTHFELAVAFLTNGVHVLIEKPMTLNPFESSFLQRFTKNNKLVVAVGHTFLYNAGIRMLKDEIRSPSFGVLKYLQSTRTNPGPIRKDVNVLWDLAPHDVAIFNFLLGSQPTVVSAMGSRDTVFLTLNYPANFLANIHVSWVDPVKTRVLTAIGNTKLVYDDSNPVTGAIEPLKAQLLDFLRAITEGETPVSDGQVGHDVVNVLTAAQASMELSGTPISVRAF